MFNTYINSVHVNYTREYFSAVMIKYKDNKFPYNVSHRFTENRFLFHPAVVIHSSYIRIHFCNFVEMYGNKELPFILVLPFCSRWQHWKERGGYSLA